MSDGFVERSLPIIPNVYKSLRADLKILRSKHDHPYTILLRCNKLYNIRIIYE